MSELQPFTNIPPFINRDVEMRFLQSWIEEKPKNILFLYGPKSSGKTTLIYQFIERNLPRTEYDIKHFNLRKLLLINYESFLRAFFERKDSQQVKETRQYDLKVFKLSVETLKGLESRELDPFIVMEKELEKINKKGKRPLIIIDELQALAEIYFNGGRELINEMFNFFVAMTKESHLCHVLIASSDGYFIERLYNDSKLRKTSELFEVDYLPKEDIVYWLNNLEKESNITDFILTSEQIEYFWEHFGGSIWEISNLLGKMISIAQKSTVPRPEMERIVSRYMMQAKSYFKEYGALDPSRTALLREIYAAVSRNGCFDELALGGLLNNEVYADKKALQEELRYLVQQNFLYYNPTLAEYKLQGRSMEIGLGMFLHEVDAVRA
ncbi:ATP-binding protein [Desulfonatronovibrio magnus]|uniref:ATP-binding protein n=1 Tax=Desulfonatronovibrio magnus TaxID=698827 RepID=UPI000697E7EA|nr:ATP-binding protein [Desulfonatronovibrio magnus]